MLSWFQFQTEDDCDTEIQRWNEIQGRFQGVTFKPGLTKSQRSPVGIATVQ